MIIISISLIIFVIGVLEVYHDWHPLIVPDEIMLGQSGIINKGQMLATCMPTKVMSFSVVFMKVSEVSECFEFNLSCSFIPHLFA